MAAWLDMFAPALTHLIPQLDDRGSTVCWFSCWRCWPRVPHYARGPQMPKCFQFNCLPNYVGCGDLVLNFGSKTSGIWMVATTFTSSSSCALWRFLVRLFPRSAQPSCSSDLAFKRFPSTCELEVATQGAKQKTKRFTKGMVLKYHQEILYPTKQANWRAAESSPLAGVLKRPLHLHQSSKWLAHSKGGHNKETCRLKGPTWSILSLLANWPPLPPPFSRMDPTFASNCCVSRSGLALGPDLAAAHSHLDQRMDTPK